MIFTTVVIAQEQPEDDIYMMSLEELMDVKVITAARIEQKISEASANITVITAEEIKNSGAHTLSDVLKLLPGIQITTHRKGLGRIWLRGITSRYNDKTLLLVDGLPWRDLIYGHLPIDERLSLANIKKVEVIKGPGSALYGTNAFSGVINIITKDAADIDGYQAVAGFGSWNTQSHHVLYSKKYDRGEAVFFANFYNTKGDEHERDRTGQPTNRRKPLRQVELNFKGALGNLTFGARHIRYNWENFSYEDSRDKYADWQESFLNIGYSKNMSEQLKLSVQSYYNLFDYSENSFKRNDNYLAEIKDRMESTIVWGGWIHAEYIINPNNTIVSAIEYEIEHIHNVLETSYLTEEEYPEQLISRWLEPKDIHHNANWAFIIEDILKVNRRINVVTGIRYDMHEEYGGAVSPRGALVLNPAGNFITKVLYGRAFRAPSYRELYIKNDDKEDDGNNALKPEYIQTVELNLSYLVIKQMKLNLNLFSQSIEDVISRKILSDGSTWENRGKVKINGVESGIELNLPNKNIVGFVNYTYFLKAECGNGDELSNIAKQMANIGINTKIGKFLNVNASINHIGRRNKPDDYQGKVDDPDKRDNLGRYERVNLALTSRNLPIDISFRIYNVFDVQSFHPSFEPGRYYDIEHPGRNFLLKLGSKF